MSITTTPVGRYSTNEAVPATTGSDMQEQFARMKARLVARYRLAAVPGRPEELVSPATPEGDLVRGVSLGYGCRTIRVRLMAGRDWIRTEDFQISEGWQTRLYDMCDTYFNYGGPDTVARAVRSATQPEPILSMNTAEVKPRPIRDNPQA